METFEKLLQYLYLGRLHAQKFNSEVREETKLNHVALLPKVYVAADK